MTALDLVASPVRGIARNTFRESLGSAPALDYLSNRLFIANTPRLDGKIYGEQPGRGTQRDEQPGRCVKLDGADSYITYGDLSASVKSISLWVKADDITAHTDYLLDLNGTDYITIVNGEVTANGFSGATVTVYVDGIEDATIPNTTAFHHVLISSDTGFSASDVDLGRLSGTGFYAGYAFDLRLSTAELTSTHASQLATLRSDELPNETFVLHDKLDSQHATISYDSSGNVNNGTQTSWDTTVGSGNFYEGSDVPFSWQNDKGFSTGLIPRDESAKTLDVTGAALTYTGECPQNGLFDQNNAGTFNGSSFYIDVGNLSASLKTIEFWCKPDSITSRTDYVIDLNGTDYITIVNGTVTKNGFSGATVKIYVDGVLSSTIPNITEPHHVAIVSDTGFSASDFDIGRLEGTGWYDGLLFGVRVFTDELTAVEVLGEYNRTAATLDNCVGYWPICEGGGTVVHNVNAVGLNGTATSIAENTFWGTKQSKFNYTGSHGHTLLTHATSLPIRVPYLVSGVPNTYAIPSGYSKVEDNPATTGHNNCESSIDLTGGVAAPRKRWDRPVNLLTFSESFDNAAWTKLSCSVTPNAVEASDGTMSMDLVVPASGTVFPRVSRNVTMTAGTQYQLSSFVKKKDYRYCYLAIDSDTACFDLDTGAFTSVSANFTASVEALPSGVYRLKVLHTPGSTSSKDVRVLGFSSNGTTTTFTDGDGASGNYAWGAQLTTTPGEYMPSDWSDTPPRFSMPNEMLSYRSQFDNAWWSKTAASIDPNVVATKDPDGGNNADKLVENGALSIHVVYKTGISIQSIWYKHSVYAKSAGRSELWVENNITGSYVINRFNLSTGTMVAVGAGCNAYMTDVGSGWYLCEIICLGSAGTREVNFFLSNGTTKTYTGDTSSGIYLYNASLVPWTNPNPNYNRITYKNGVPFKADRITRYDRVLIGSRNDAAETYTQDVAL